MQTPPPGRGYPTARPVQPRPARGTPGAVRQAGKRAQPPQPRPLLQPVTRHIVPLRPIPRGMTALKSPENNVLKTKGGRNDKIPIESPFRSLDNQLSSIRGFASPGFKRLGADTLPKNVTKNVTPIPFDDRVSPIPDLSTPPRPPLKLVSRSTNHVPSREPFSPAVSSRSPGWASLPEDYKPLGTSWNSETKNSPFGEVDDTSSYFDDYLLEEVTTAEDLHNSNAVFDGANGELEIEEDEEEEEDDEDDEEDEEEIELVHNFTYEEDLLDGVDRKRPDSVRCKFNSLRELISDKIQNSDASSNGDSSSFLNQDRRSHSSSFMSWTDTSIVAQSSGSAGDNSMLNATSVEIAAQAMAKRSQESANAFKEYARELERKLLESEAQRLLVVERAQVLEIHRLALGILCAACAPALLVAVLSHNHSFYDVKITNFFIICWIMTLYLLLYYAYHLLARIRRTISEREKEEERSAHKHAMREEQRQFSLYKNIEEKPQGEGPELIQRDGTLKRQQSHHSSSSSSSNNNNNNNNNYNYNYKKNNNKGSENRMHMANTQQVELTSWKGTTAAQAVRKRRTASKLSV